ncbi:MAG: NAD(P)-dependent alcohol dehydrogenase [Chitinophagales bacterium]
MKAIQVNGGGLDNLQIVERPNPTPKAGEILVQWHATSLNFHDYLVAIGGIKVPENRVPMSDGAGEVIAVGEGVTKWKTGDKVMSLFFPNWIEGTPTFEKTRFISGETVDGYVVERSCISVESVTAIPEGYTYAEAATIPCAGLTAWRGLVTEGKLKAGDTVLIEGTGGMSIFGLQIALAAGAKVYVTTSSNEKAERLKEMGATAVVNYKEDSSWGKTIFKLSGDGVDHVLDVGGGSTMYNSIEAAKIGGNIISIGILGNGRKGEITFPKLFFKHLRLIGVAVDCRVSQEEMVRAINVSGFKPVIDRSFGFDQLADAFRYQETGQHFGKIVLEW